MDAYCRVVKCDETGVSFGHGSHSGVRLRIARRTGRVQVCFSKQGAGEFQAPLQKTQVHQYCSFNPSNSEQLIMATTRRIALVTGGMGGLGEAICIKLAKLGDTVATTYSPGNTKSEQWLTLMREQGYQFYAYPCDVADWESCRACIRKMTEALGPVDVLINNAGVTRDMTFKKMDKINWDAVMHANLDSCFNMTKQVCDSMMDRGWGRIINISSVNGQKGAFGQTNYSAAKAGMHGFTKALALEVVRKGVTVNTISPGYIGTKMVMAIPKEVLDSKIIPQIPMGRLGKPEEVAGLVAYLASEEAAFVTGANIAINGGQHMQ